MPLEGKERQDFIKSFITHLFSDKFNPKKFAGSIAMVFQDKNLLADIHKHWIESNKHIEEKIYKEFGNNASKEIKQIVDQKQRNFDGYYKFAQTMEGFNETEVRNWLPANKLLFNQDLFHNRLRGLDLANIDPAVERRILQSLEKESKALNRQEVLLYYSLIKANKMAAAEDQTKRKRKTEEAKFYKALAGALVGLIYPRHINASILTEINKGVKIERDVILETLIDKIKNQNFPAYPYLLFFGFKKHEKMFGNFVNMLQLGKYFGEDPEKLLHYTLFYIIFKNASEKYQKFANIQPELLDFMNAKTSAPFSPEGAAFIRFLDTFFYALCTQIYEINRSYQKADDNKKAKIYKLYSADDRLRMIVKNSLSVGIKVIQRMKADHSKLSGTVTRFINKESKLLTKEDIFSSVLDFDDIIMKM